MAARLKVFTWSDGFHRYTVAAGSRAKALEVWGFRRDLFKTGDAQEIKSGDDYSEALAHPGVSVERGLAIDVGKIKLKTPAPPKPKPAAPSARDLEQIRQLEVQLDASAKAFADAKADINSRRQVLDREFATTESDFKIKRRDLTTRLEAARRKIRLS